MTDWLGAVVRGAFTLVGQLGVALDMNELRDDRRRGRRLASLARGGRVEIPCVLRDAELTGNRRLEGILRVGGPPVFWQAKGEARAVVFDPGPLTLEAVGRKSLAFRSEGDRTELCVHPDEAPPILRALAG
jgi:hypothetical protein